MRATGESEFEDRTAHLLKLASKAAARALQVRLAAVGVSYAHWTLLRILWKKSDLSITELARLANVAKPAVVIAIRAMEKKGYVKRRRKKGNLKAIYIDLTRGGAALEDKLIALALDVNKIALDGVSEQQELRFRGVLVKIIRNLGAESRARAE